MKYKIIRVVAVIVMLNIVYVPFICNKFWSLKSEHSRSQAVYFFDTIESVRDGWSPDDVAPIHVMYYLGGLVCTLFIFISALSKSTGACRFGSLIGIGLSLYLFYQVHSGTIIWYVHGNNAHLTYGYYISCVGFASMLTVSLVPQKETARAAQ